ncbi:MAG: exo-alpha-sialidase [Bacteroidales bacterium]|nr:exo-alpha-sialidase [Bacteroidales bacterium]
MNRYFWLAAALPALAGGCSPQQMETPETMTLSCSLETSRTALSGTKVIWQPGDAIVVNGNASTGITIAPDNPSSASFTLPVLSAPYYAIYPAGAFVTGSYRPALAQYGNVELPAKQAYAANSFDPAASVMIGKQTGAVAELEFRHAVAWIRFTVSGAAPQPAIKSVRITAAGGEQLSGTFQFKPAAMSLQASGGSPTVELLHPAGIAQGQPMLVAIPAGTYASGLKVRIADVTGRLMHISSAKSFTATAGVIYNTTVNYVPDGTEVDAHAGDVDDSNMEITPYWMLNAGNGELNSHAGQTSRSMLTYVGNSYVELGEDVTTLPMPSYPRFIRTKDHRWLLFYHNGIYTESTEKYTWAGTECYILESSDMKHWHSPRKIFARDYNVSSPYGDTFQRIYAGAHPLRLPDGRLMVVASYRRSGDFRHRIKDNGLVFKFSSDEGRTWSAGQYINVGTTWEPRPIVLSSGRVVVYYTDSRPYVEGVWDNAVVSSGVSYIYSDNNGLTWQPSNALEDHLWAFRQVRDQKNGTKIYTDQMPGVIALNGSRQLVGCGEANFAKADATTSNYWVSMAYSDGSGNWGSPDADGVMPSDRVNQKFKGAAPTIEQFPSGEIVLTYNSNNIFYRVFGDETGRNFADPVRMFGASSADYPMGHGFWGSCLADGHVLLAGTAGEGGAKGKGFFIEVGQHYLNHNIRASSRQVTVDGRNGDWSTSDQALFLGSAGDMHATLRASVCGGMLYFLAELENAALSASDYVRIYLANASKSAIASGDVYLQSTLGGTLSCCKWGGSWASASLSAASAVSRGDGVAVVEFSVPLSQLPASGSALLVNFAVQDSNDGFQSLLPVPGGTAASKNTSSWMKLTY